MSSTLIESPTLLPQTFLDFPMATNLDRLEADIAILGVPYGKPYVEEALINDQSRAPDKLRQYASKADIFYTRNHYDWDLNGPLLDDREIRVVDCGNVAADKDDKSAHYKNAEQAARKIFTQGATLVTIGGDHGIPIPVMRALDVFDEKITLIQIDAHIDWRHEINEETEGYSSTIKRASELPWIGDIFQIGLRGVGSARTGEVEEAKRHGAKLISAYEMHEVGMDAILEMIPEKGPYYLTVDADGLDPTIMPGVMAQTPGGLTWVQIRKLIHGLVNKGNVLGMDLVEIAPSNDVGNTTMIHAERLICNFIGACVRANYYK